MVTFLLLEGIVPGKRNCLQVIDEIHEIRSPSSVSGLRFSLTTRFPAGSAWQLLKVRSPIWVGSFEAGVELEGVGQVGVARGARTAAPAGRAAPGALGIPGTLAASRRPRRRAGPTAGAEGAETPTG